MWGDTTEVQRNEACPAKLWGDKNEKEQQETQSGEENEKERQKTLSVEEKISQEQYIELIKEGDRLKKEHQFCKGDEPILSTDINKLEKSNPIADCLQQRRYDMRLYAKYRDKIEVQNKLQQYKEGKLKVDDILPTINQLNSNKNIKPAKKTSAYGKSIEYIAE